MSRADRQRMQRELQALEKAILDILEGGQSVTVTTAGGTRQVTMANLKELYARQAYLERRLRSGPRFRQGVPT